MAYANALQHAEQAVKFGPNFGANHAALGTSLLQLGRVDEAQLALTRAVELDPSIAIAHNGLGILALRALRYNDAEQHFINAIEAYPDDTAALCNFATMLKDTGRGDETTALISPALEMLPDNVGVQWAGALMSNYAADLSPEQVTDRHRRFGAAAAKAVGPSTWFAPRRASDAGPLRVGFLSPDMRRHSVAFFLLPLLESMNHEKFHVSCYSLCGKGDELTPRFEAASDTWRDVSGMTDMQVADQIRGDRVDILIECAGLFNGARPAVLAMRVAPVQVTWLGYPNTTGMDQVDYRLVDAVTDPPGSERYAVENLSKLNGCFVCYHPLDALPPVTYRNDPASPIRFGCFNVLSKFNDQLLDTWAKLLREVPSSKLMLKTQALCSQNVRDRVCDAFISRGIDPDRLELISYIESQAEHRALYNRVDIALDTFPYCGTTTTCEALTMGVPVITLIGQAHPGRVGASLLRAAGREQWVAATPDEYVSIAKMLADDRKRLDQLRCTLGSEVLSSPLCDANGYAQRFEEALIAVSKQGR